MNRRAPFLPLLMVGAQLWLPARTLLAAPAARPTQAAAPSSTASAAPAPGSASNDERAAALRDTGNQAMLEMRYVDALAAYQQAAALAPSYSGVLYSIARAHQMLGDFTQALRALEQFEQQASPEAKAKVGQLDRLFTDLRSRVGTLRLTCNVTGARVLVRDKVIGTTPLPATLLPSGSATLELELDGFFPLRREIVVPGGGALALELDLHARLSSGLLIVRTTPGGARVSVNGQPQGTSSPSIELALLAGNHRISATREGYEDASVPIVLRAGATRNVQLELEPARPLSSRWWFWAGAGAVVAGGIALTVALLTESPADKGTLPPGQISAPLRF
ncbi:MAG TPA: PEGA domain-containing protein [Polyangiaceae bacterium]|nr:PEGA domain-containing protein [Polyangiaceae bacterium]